jgi:hypothetical protein
VPYFSPIETEMVEKYSAISEGKDSMGYFSKYAIS